MVVIIAVLFVLAVGLAALAYMLALARSARADHRAVQQLGTTRAPN
jgi:Tfp pilus assembly protein PilV